ncbi:MAG: molybdopterin molybdotransferase MoeA, partial [Verrucomicrobiota bacterium]|nr:molybdopterin molybdotransferase MoeA [Verrucomicrobiota bacterium]
FDNSAMDGYAIIASDATAGARLRVVAEQPAGRTRDLCVSRGEAIRIFTGAPLPNGADAVIMQEDVEREADEIVLRQDVQPGEFVRRRGGDVAAGQMIVRAGERIRPETIALLASQGLKELEVGGEVTAAIVSTGDELVAPGVALQPGQIYESNTPLLRALLSQLGVRVLSVVHSPDRQESIEAAVRAGITADILIISGGVSVGARDLVKPALAAAGAELDLWRVAVKPGKPFLFGHAGRCSIFGLPGNPVSAFVTFLLFVRPAALRMMRAGETALEMPKQSAVLVSAVHNDGDRPHYMRGAVEGGRFTPLPRQESHALFGLSRSNALLLVAPHERFDAGGAVTVFTWE